MLLFTDRTAQDLALAVTLMASCMILLALPRMKKRYKSHDDIIRVRRVGAWPRSMILDRMEARLIPLSALRKKNAAILESVVQGTGQSYDVDAASTKFTRIAYLSIIPGIITSAVLSVHVSPIFIAAIMAPFVAFVSPYIRLRLQIAERRERIEEEMAYFLIYVNAMQVIGFGLYRSFERIRGEGIFNAMEADAAEIIKRVRMIGMTQNESLSTYGRNHPSKLFRDFVSGYMAKIQSVGNVPGYTESKAHHFFQEYLGAWDRYTKSAAEIFGVTIMVAVILPMIIMFTSMLAGAGTAALMIVTSMVISPTVSVGMILMLNKYQPTTGTYVPTYWMSFVAGGAACIILLLVGIEASHAIASGIAAGAIANHMATRRERRRVMAVEDAMPEFLSDVTEMSKAGYNINQIMIKQSRRGTYQRDFNEVVSSIITRTAEGMPFDVAVRGINTRSSHVRCIMFLLSQTYRSGAANPDLFHGITEFMTRMQQVKSGASKSLRPMLFIVLFCPFLMLGITEMMAMMFEDMASSSPGGSFGFAYDPGLGRMFNVLTLATVVPMGVVAAKMSSYTVRDTMPVAMVSIAFMLALFLVPVMVQSMGAIL